jgi:hypothetical protein
VLTCSLLQRCLADTSDTLRRCAITGLCSMLPVALALPLLSLSGAGAAQRAAMLAACVAVYAAYTALRFTFSSCSVLMNETAMSPELREHVGAVNGAGATFAGVMWFAEPALAGWAWSLVAALSTSGAQFAPWLGVAGMIVTSVAILSRA